MKAFQFTAIAYAMSVALSGPICFGAPVPLATKPKERATLNAHKHSVLCLAFSPDGKTLASGGYDNTAKLWDVASGKNTAILEGDTKSVYVVAFSPEGKMLATTWNKGRIGLWDVATGKNVGIINAKWEGINNLVFRPESNSLLFGYQGCSIWSADIQTRKTKQIFQKKPDSLKPWSSVVYSPESKLLAATVTRSNPQFDAGEFNLIHLWDVEADKKIETFGGDGAGIFCLAFSRDCRLLASGANEQLNLWNIATGKRTIVSLIKAPDQISCLAFSPDGKTLAIGIKPNGDTKEGPICLLDVDSGKQLATLTGHTGALFCVVFSPDGNTLASGSMDKTIKLWDVRSLKRR